MKTKNNVNSVSNTNTNINPIKTRMFVLSPTVKDYTDNECSKKTFVQEDSVPIILGYVGKALVVTHKITMKMYCIKAIKKEIFSQSTIDLTNKQLDIMYKVRHPSFLRLLNHFEDDSYLFCIFQPINENTLYDLIQERKLTESKIQKYFRQILIAVQYLHNLNISYISLEPESIIIDKHDNIRLTDYAWSKLLNIELNKRNSIELGKKMYVNAYVPPEVIVESHSSSSSAFRISRSLGNKESDVWQLGVLLYEMITYKMPFDTKNVLNDIIKFDIKKIDMNAISKDYNFYKELIPRTLVKDPSMRISIEEMLNYREMNDVNLFYELTPIDPNEQIINKKIKHATRSLEEQLIEKLKIEKVNMSREITSLKSKMELLIKENTELKKANQELKDISEIPNKELIDRVADLNTQIIKLNREKEFLSETEANNVELLKQVERITKDKNELENELAEVNIKYQKEISNLQELLTKPQNANKTSNFIRIYIPLLEESIRNFKNVIEKTTSHAKDTNEYYINAFSAMLDNKEKLYKELLINSNGNVLQTQDNMNCLRLSLEEFDKKINERVNWYKPQFEEFTALKRKFSRLEEIENKLNNDKKILEDKIQIIENKNDVLEKIEKLTKEKCKDLEKEITQIKGMLKDMIDFIKQNCPDKVNMLKKIVDLNDDVL